MRAETKRRREFEAHVKEQLGFVKQAIDLILKSMELEELQHDEHERTRAPHV